MRKGLKRWGPMLAIAAGAIAVQVALPSSFEAAAHDYKKGTLTIDHPWARPTLPSIGNAAVYMDIRNSGSEPDRLLGAKTNLTATVEVHGTTEENGVMKMRRAENGVEVPASGSVKFQPGGFHIMLVGVKEPLKEGSRHPLTLMFQKAGEVTVDIAVEKGASHPAPSADTHKHH
jgi:copper(I)-binding protein